MKTRFSSRQQGSTIFITLFIAGLIALTLTAYLSWADTQSKLATRAQSWNAALPMVEAGLEEALVHLNFSPTRTTNGWTLNNTNYVKQRTFGDGYYLVKVSTDEPPIIISQGFVRAPLQNNIYISRSVVVTCFKTYPSSGGILAKGGVTFKGGAIVDSYNSSDPLYSTLGQYDVSKREDHATIQSNSGAAGAVTVGPANVWGSVATGPGGTVSVANNGSVGDMAFHAANGSGIEAGASSANVNTWFPDVPAPFTNGGFGLPAGNVLYTYVFSSGNYKIGALSMSSSQSILIAGPGTTTLYCDGGISESGQSFIRIAVGASLKLYVNNGDIALTGGGVVNDTQLAINCSIYGMPQCNNVKTAGNTAFIGTIYAPEASVTLSGTSGYYGSVVGNDVTMSTGSGFHYDEALSGALRSLYIASSWNEF